MDQLKYDAFNALIIGSIYLVIFTLAELWRKFGTPKAEYTRKFVHLASGAVCLSFSWVFSTHWTVLILCAVFAVIIALTRKFNLLNSVHGVERKSKGGYYFPLAIYFTFLIANMNNRPEYYFIAVLTLAFSDSLAALIGTSYGKKFYEVEDDNKTIEGTVVFFLVTFIIVHLSLLFLTDLSELATVLSALFISFLITSFESISLGGSDNFFIPVGTIAILLKITLQTEQEMIRQIFAMLAIFIFIYLLLTKRNIKISGIIGVALICYGSYALIDLSWAYITLLTITVYSFSNIPSDYLDSKHGIRNVFYMSITALFWILTANYSGLEYNLFFLPFAVCVISAMAVLINYQLYLNETEKAPLSLLKGLHPLLRVLLISIVFLTPYLLFNRPPSLFFFFTAGTFSAILIVWIYHQLQKGKETMAAKVRIFSLVTLLYSLILFFVTDYFMNNKSVIDEIIYR